MMFSINKPHSKQRIAVVVPKYGLIGGGEKFAYELTERLSLREGYEFHVFANQWNSGSSRIFFHKVPMVRFPRFLKPLSFAWFANRMISRGQFDLVHTHERIFHANIFSMHSVPHADWVRNVRNKRPSLFDLTMNRIEEYAMKSAKNTLILPVSTLARDTFLQKYAFDSTRIRVIHPGVDTRKFSSLDREECRREIRTRYRIGLSETVILFVGMNFKLKGLDAIMASVAKAKERHPGHEIRLLIVGKGNYGGYEQLAQTLGIKESVIFTGPLTEGIEQYYLASDIFMMLSKFDTFGMAVLEAMAARLPVIISTNVGAKDLVIDGVNGFVIKDIADSDDISNKISFLLDKGLRQHIGNEAFKTAENHSWDAMAAAVEGVYKELLSMRHDTAEG